MTFAVTYREKSGAKAEVEIEAANRAACFAQCKARGIVPLGVREGRAKRVGGQDGPSPVRKLFTIRFYLFVAIAALAAIAAWWLTGARDARPYQIDTPQGPVTLSVATPLARQRIPGDRVRIEAAIAQERDPPVFRFAAERWLARYAEPGRPPLANHEQRVTNQDFKAALREPIHIASTDFTEVVDLKRIVTGMKREMGAYLAAGGTAEQYLAELEKRQKLEISYRERAELGLGKMLAASTASRHPAQDRLREAYEYWLKANAQLKSMGIWEIPLPEALRTYQMGLDIDE